MYEFIIVCDGATLLTVIDYIILTVSLIIPHIEQYYCIAIVIVVVPTTGIISRLLVHSCVLCTVKHVYDTFITVLEGLH